MELGCGMAGGFMPGRGAGGVYTGLAVRATLKLGSTERLQQGGCCVGEWRMMRFVDFFWELCQSIVDACVERAGRGEKAVGTGDV